MTNAEPTDTDITTDADSTAPAEDRQDRDDAVGTADIAAASGQRVTDDEGDDELDDGLFPPGDSSSFEQRWTELQSRFVDDPRDAVASADHLVAEVMQSLARSFTDQKAALEHQWEDEGEADTEELRRAMQHYRTFFQRLLAA